jgi:hypothetical protein
VADVDVAVGTGAGRERVAVRTRRLAGAATPVDRSLISAEIGMQESERGGEESEVHRR